MGFMTICLIFSLPVVRTSIVKDLLCARHYSRQLTCIVTYCSGHHQNCPFYFKKWKDRFWELKQLPCIRVFLSCISYFLLCPNAWPKKGRREVVVLLLLFLPDSRFEGIWSIVMREVCTQSATWQQECESACSSGKIRVQRRWMPVLGSLLPVSSFIPPSLTAYGMVPSSCRIGLPHSVSGLWYITEDIPRYVPQSPP